MLGPVERGLEGALLADRYRIEKRLGAGGMGEVYRAVNEVIGRPVAIKVLHAEMTRSPEIVARFLREAKAASLVRHPNVVDVLDVLEHDGVPFIVQELLSGRDLAAYIEVCGGRLTAEEALPIMIPVVEAVGIAHAKGVVHRDLKPENVFLHEVEGQVIPKVLDFGISKITKGDVQRMTGTGMAMGTPAYMSPEQIQGSGDVDARADVWSLGVMLFELFSGALPFVGETPGALFVQVCTTEARRLDAVLPDAPSAIVEIVAKCLRPRAAERYATASELAKALRAVLAERGVDSTRKLQAIGPSIIEALDAKLGVAETVRPQAPIASEASAPTTEASSKNADQRTAVARPGARAAPNANANANADARAELPAPTEVSTEQPERKRRPAVFATFAGVALLAVLATAAAVKGTSGADAVSHDARDAGAIAQQVTESDAGSVSNAIAPEAIADAAATVAALDRDADSVEPSQTAQSAQNAVESEDAAVARVRTRHGTRDTARAHTTTTHAQTTQTAQTTQGTQGAATNASSAQTSQGTAATTGRRQTHAAIEY